MTRLEKSFPFLTVADVGTIAVALDDVAHLGDDDATDAVADALDVPFAARVAYAVVHTFKRSI